MRSWPLKWRLSIAICLTLSLTTVIIYIVSYVELKESLLKNLEPALKAMTEAVLSDLDDAKTREDHAAFLQSLIDYPSKKNMNGYQIWMDGSEKDLFISDPLADVQDLRGDLPSDIQPEIGEFVFFNINTKKEKYRAVWTRHILEQGIVNILIVTSSSYVYHEMGEFLRLLFILGGSLTAGSLLLVPAIVSLALRPVDDVAEIIRQVTPGRIKKQEQLHRLKIPKELLPFVEALDEMLVRLDKTIRQQKQFIADASHELRTPLTVIKSTIQTARMSDREVADYIKTLDDTLQDVNRMEQLIEHLLSLARLDEGEGLSNPSPVNLSALLTNLADIYDAKKEKYGGRVICDALFSAVVNGDENELSQLFTNILDNALKYGPPNGTVRITLVHEPKDYAAVCVHDEGGNIPADVLPHVFDRFYRADSSRSRATGGTGLGLAIAKEITQRHGGQIEITSDPHTGTSVFVRLPRI